MYALVYERSNMMFNNCIDSASDYTFLMPILCQAAAIGLPTGRSILGELMKLFIALGLKARARKQRR